MPSASKKRKLSDGETKYYAVRAGKLPGVYTQWADCQANTFGFKGATYKAFLSRKDAEDFVAGRNPLDSGQPDKFYGVAVGHEPGVYTEWTECQKQIVNVKGPKYKRFATRKEAEEFVKSGGKTPPATAASKVSMKSAPDADVEDGRAAKKVKVGTSTTPSSRGKVTVYTDGSSRGNGQVGAVAGVGVYFGQNDSRNVSEPLLGNPQTNQRAELTAIIRALEIAPKDRDLEIVTDSEYSIKCATVWYKSWMAKNWLRGDGGEVKNKDLVMSIRELVDHRIARGADTKFTWIKGHDNHPGNEAADRLAVAGAMSRR